MFDVHQQIDHCEQLHEAAAKLPKEVYDHRSWRTDQPDCGTTFCLGGLGAQEKIGGLYWSGNAPAHASSAIEWQSTSIQDSLDHVFGPCAYDHVFSPLIANPDWGRDEALTSLEQHIDYLRKASSKETPDLWFVTVQRTDIEAPLTWYFDSLEQMQKAREVCGRRAYLSGDFHGSIPEGDFITEAFEMECWIRGL